MSKLPLPHTVLLLIWCRGCLATLYYKKTFREYTHVFPRSFLIWTQKNWVLLKIIAEILYYTIPHDLKFCYTPFLFVKNTRCHSSQKYCDSQDLELLKIVLHLGEGGRSLKEAVLFLNTFLPIFSLLVCDKHIYMPLWIENGTTIWKAVWI